MDDPIQFAAIILISFVVGWPTVSLLVAVVGGWRALAEHYASAAAFPGRRFWFRSAQFGQASYGACLVFAANHDGIHLSAILPFRIGHPPFFVPWGDVSCSDSHSVVVALSELRFAKQPQVSIIISRRLANALVELRPRDPA